MKYSSIWLLNLTILSVFVADHFCARSQFSRPDGKENEASVSEELVKSFGFPIQTFEVRTADRYILTVFRLPNKRSRKSPVFLQHGIHASSTHFLANKFSLAYHLFNKGYDVWIGNSRGTSFSNEHVKLSHYKDDYWNFSFNEMGRYDIPAVLKFIREETKKPKVHYVGHSLGTTMFLVMGCKRPAELEGIKGVVFMAPVTRPKHIELLEKPFKNKIVEATMITLNSFGVKKIQPPKTYGLFVQWMCKGVSGRFPDWCRKKLAGSNPDNFDFDNTLLHKAWWLYDDVSLKNHMHFLQIAKAGKLQEYDYGKRRNQRLYRSNKPAIYDLGSIKKRIYLISGGDDNIATDKDIGWLHSKLQDPWLIGADIEDFNRNQFNQGQKTEQLHKTVDILLEAAEKNRDPKIPKDEPLIPTSESSSGERHLAGIKGGSDKEECTNCFKIDGENESGKIGAEEKDEGEQKGRNVRGKRRRGRKNRHMDEEDDKENERVSKVEKMLETLTNMINNLLSFLGIGGTAGQETQTAPSGGMDAQSKTMVLGLVSDMMKQQNAAGAGTSATNA